MSDHDPYCRCSDPSWSNPVHCTCEKIRMIRADERKREALRGPSTAWYDAHERAVLADLRAQVKALPPPADGLWDVVRRSDVLALLTGGE